MSLYLGLLGGLDEFWPLFGSNVGLAKSGVAIFFGVMYGVQAVGSAFAHRFSGISNRAIYLTCAVIGVLLTFAALTFKGYSILFLLSLGLLLQVVNTVLNGKLQHAIPTETRATVSSVKEFMADSSAAASLVSFGAIAGATSYRTGFMAFGFVIVLVGSAYVLASLRRPLPFVRGD
jgi:hypothetical protein